MSFDGIKFNLSDFPEGKRLEVWAEYVHLSQNIAPREITGTWYHGHLYVHQSKTNPNQFILKPPVYLYDLEYRQLNLTDIFQLTHDLMQISSDKIPPATLVIQTLNKHIAGMGNQPAIEKLRQIFQSCIELSVPQKMPNSELRRQIMILRRYLATNNIFGGYSHDLSEQYKELVGLVKEFWKPLQVPGVYNPTIVDKQYKAQSIPLQVNQAQSFLAEYPLVPPELKWLYEETLKEKFGNPFFYCYFVIRRDCIHPNLLEIIERNFKEAILLHLKKSEHLYFNSIPEEDLQPNPVYIQAFKEYAKEHFTSSTPKDRKRIAFSRYDGIFADLLPFCNTLQLNALGLREVEDMVQKIKVVYSQKHKWMANIFICNKSHFGDLGLSRLKELELPPGPFEAGPYELELHSSSDNLLLVSRKYEEQRKLQEDQLKNIQKVLHRHMMEGDGAFQVIVPQNPLKEKTKPLKDDGNPPIDLKELRKRNQRFLDNLQKS